MDPAAIVTLGATDVPVSRLTLGGTPFGGMWEEVPDDRAVATINAAFAAGVRSLDTAPLYGLGKSERKIGLALQELPREELTICTKVGRILQDDDGTIPPTFEYTSEAIERSLVGSYKRLGTNHVDVVHVHDPDRHMDEVMEVTFPTMQRMKADGIIRAVSAGMNWAAPLTRFVEAGLVDCVLLAGQWTLLDQTAIDELLPAAAGSGISVIAAGAFNSGILADPDADPRFARFKYQAPPPEVLTRVHAISDVCADHGVGLRAAALQFPLTHAAVASVCVGCRSSEEVAANVADLQEAIPIGLWSDLAGAGLLRPEAVPAA